MNAPLDRRPIPGWPGYLAGADGTIYTTKRGHVAGRALSVLRCTNGYTKVAIQRDRKKGQCTIHRLVALAWLPNPDGMPQVNHRNGIKDDNRVENLEWCTASANKLHAHANGLVNLDTERFRNAVRENAKKARAQHEANVAARRAAR